MYERISSELFSSLVNKMNQFPNNTTPIKENVLLKELQKISQILNIFNIEAKHKDILNKLFSNLSSPLKTFLYQIMVIIGTKFNSFDLKTENNLPNSIKELFELCSSTWKYFNEKNHYFKISENVDSQILIKQYEETLKESICFSCGLINIVIQMFKRHFYILETISKKFNVINSINSTSINGGIFNDFSKENIQRDLNMLFIISRNRTWFEPLVTLLDQIFKFILNNDFYKLIGPKMEKIKKFEKEKKITKSEIKKLIDSYINYIIDEENILKSIFTLVKKYHSLNKSNIIIGSIIPINEINSLFQNFFNIYFVLLINKENTSMEYTEEESYCLGIYIINCLNNSKFRDPTYGVDFISYFYTSQSFINDFLDEINSKIVSSYTELIYNWKNGLPSLQKSNLNVLQNFENCLKDYIIYAMIASYNKDSLCDCYINCENHKKIFITYGLVRSYIIVNLSLEKEENNKNNIIGKIVDSFLKELEKYKIILPVKMFIYKNYLLFGIFIIFHNFVKYFSQEIIELYKDNQKQLKEKMSLIKEINESINCLFFLLGSDILLTLNVPFSDNNNTDEERKPFIRFIDESNPLDYIDIIQEKVLNPLFKTSRPNNLQVFSSLFSNIEKMDICEEKENTSLFSNSKGMDYENKKFGLFPVNCALFQNETIVNYNKSSYTVMPTNNFHSKIFHTEMKKKNGMKNEQYSYRYDITSVIDNIKPAQLFLLSKLGFDCKFESDHHYIYLNEPDSINVNQVIYMNKNDIISINLINLSVLSMLKKEPFTKQIIEQLFVILLDGFDETNKGKNCELSLKYYDTQFQMDYFKFVEKCKDFLL